MAWREEAARHPPRRFRGEVYWARPIPAFGDPAARLIILGLAPAANGGNRTGRMFTGDESGSFLFRALHAVGLANRPESLRAGDGLRLSGALLTAAARCAPPDNRPLPEEFANCREYLVRELALVRGPKVIVALGALALDAGLSALAASGVVLPRPRPKFAHGASCAIGEVRFFCTYHPSQQNTFTGKLTQGMIRQVLRRARDAAMSSAGPYPPRPSP